MLRSVLLTCLCVTLFLGPLYLAQLSIDIVDGYDVVRLADQDFTPLVVLVGTTLFFYAILVCFTGKRPVFGLLRRWCEQRGAVVAVEL